MRACSCMSTSVCVYVRPTYGCVRMCRAYLCLYVRESVYIFSCMSVLLKPLTYASMRHYSCGLPTTCPDVFVPFMARVTAVSIIIKYTKSRVTPDRCMPPSVGNGTVGYAICRILIN